MAEMDDGGPAFPFEYHNQTARYQPGFYGTGDLAPGASQQFGGMSLRAYAAIKLRVPNSGIGWLDDMIREAKRDEIEGQALAGLCAHHGFNRGVTNLEDRIHNARLIADVMIVARKAVP
jgi:hypothetical protein